MVFEKKRLLLDLSGELPGSRQSGVYGTEERDNNGKIENNRHGDSKLVGVVSYSVKSWVLARSW